MAVEIIKPPNKSRISGLPYAWPTWFAVNMPKSGNSASGIMDVNGMGIGSNIHHKAHRMVIPAVAAGANSQPLEISMEYRMRAKTGPSGINHLFITNPAQKVRLL